MNRLYKCAAAAALAILAAAPQAWAASPSKVSYQGTLRKDGRLFSGTASMEFRVVNADASTEYWNSGSTDVVVSTGLFRYPLGTPNSAQFAAIAWKDVTPYVQMRVDGLWLPPEPLYSSVYSLHAVTAEGSTGTFTVNGGDLRLSGSSGSDGLIFPDGTVQYYAPGWSVAPTLTYTSFNGGAGIGIVTPVARLDVQEKLGGDPNLQFWRNSGGTVVASMTASGLLYADGSALRNLPGGADSLGTHVATMTLQMGGFPIVNAGAATVSGQLTAYSSATVAGELGVGAPRLALRPGVELSSTTAAFYGGVYVSTNIYLPAGAKYYGDGSALTGISLVDSLGTHVATMTLQMGSYPIINVGSVTANAPFTVYSSATVAGPLGVGSARLRLASGVELSSTAAVNYGGVYISTNVYLRPGSKIYGDFYGNGTGITGLTGVADNMGSHIATTTLQMGSYPIINVGSVTANAPFTVYSSATVADPLGLGAARLRLAQGVELSSAPAAAYGGVQVSTHIYLPAGAKYYGDASGLTISASNISAGTLPDARLSAAVPLLSSTQTFTGAAIFRSSAVFAYQGLSLPGVEISSGLLVSNGNVGIGVASPSQKLEVAGGVKISNSNIQSAGTLRYTAGNFEGYNGASWVALNGSFSLNTSTALWGINNTVLPNTVYAVGLASNVALGTMDAGVSKLRVTGYDNSSGYNAFLAESLNSTQLFRVRNDGNVAVGPHNPTTRLDVWAQAADPYVQVWRDSSGLVVSSMTVGGVLFADASGIRNLPGGADSLGTHIATMTLRMGTNAIENAGAITANGPFTTYSSATVAGAPGLGAARLWLASGVELSSAPAAVYGGVQVSTHIYLPPGAKYYGDGSALALSASNLSAGTVPDARLSASVPLLASTQSFSGANTFASSAAFMLANAAQPGVYVSSGLIVAAGGVGLGVLAPAARLDVQAAAAAPYAQIWRNSAGIEVASMTAAGALFADASGLRNLPAGGADNLGNHTATQNLNLAGFRLINASTITAASGAPGITLSSDTLVSGNLLASGGAVLNAGPLLVGTQLPLASLHVSSGPGYSGNLLLLSTGPAATQAFRVTGGGQVYAAKYFGDGSALTGVAATGGMQNPSTATLSMNTFNIVGVSEVDVSSNIAVGNGAGITPSVAMLAMNIFDEAYITQFNVGVGGISMVNPSVNKVSGQMAVGGNFRGAIADPNTRNFPTLIGVRATAWTQTSGVIDSARAVYVQNEQSSGTVTNNYGVYIDTPNVSGTWAIANNAGLYVADQSPYGSTSARNIYSAGANSANYFEGKVIVGGRFVLPSRTKAQLLALTPSAAGEMYYCSSGCSAMLVVVSTGTGAGNFATVMGTGAW